MTLYDLAVRFRRLIPPGVTLGSVYIDAGLKHPVGVVICRYSPPRDAIVRALRTAMTMWKLAPSDLDSYCVKLTHGKVLCGQWGHSFGCTHPWTSVVVSLYGVSVRTWWQWLLAHEFAHVMLLAQGTDGDPEHKLNHVWDRLVEVECRRNGVERDPEDRDRC